jgi:hypothetical protein
MSTSTCTACGRDLAATAAFCPGCGEATGADPQGAPSLVADASVVPPAVPAATVMAKVRPKNAVLGWFVVGTLVVTGFGAAVDPIQPISVLVALGFAVALALTRIINKRFSSGLLIGTAVVAGLMTLVGCSVIAQEAQNAGATSGNSSGYMSFLVPGVLALIAGIRGRGDA